MATPEMLREVALALPEATESPTWGGDPGFKVRKKLFAHFYPDGRLILRVDPHERDALVHAEPEKFRCDNPNMPFVEIDLAALDRQELSELVIDAWRQVAPKRLVAAFDEGATPPEVRG